MSSKFQCAACSSVETSEPKRICSTCHYEMVQIRNLVREMSRRMNFSYADVFVGIRTGVNKLIDEVNRLKRVIENR